MRRYNRMFRHIGAVIVALFVLCFILRFTGLITEISLTFGVLAALVLPLVITFHLQLTTPEETAIIQPGTGKVLLIAVYALLLVGLGPILYQYWQNSAPFTSKAINERTLDSDVRTSDTIRPVGTDMRIFLGMQRKEREVEITRWTIAAMKNADSCFQSGTGCSKIVPAGPNTPANYANHKGNLVEREAMEARIVLDKQRNLAKVVENLKLNGLPEPEPTSLIDWHRFDWISEKSDDPVFWGFIIVFGLAGLHYITPKKKG